MSVSVVPSDFSLTDSFGLVGCGGGISVLSWTQQTLNYCVCAGGLKAQVTPSAIRRGPHDVLDYLCSCCGALSTSPCQWF